MRSTRPIILMLADRMANGHGNVTIIEGRLADIENRHDKRKRDPYEEEAKGLFALARKHGLAQKNGKTTKTAIDNHEMARFLSCQVPASAHRYPTPPTYRRRQREPCQPIPLIPYNKTLPMPIGEPGHCLALSLHDTHKKQGAVHVPVNHPRLTTKDASFFLRDPLCGVLSASRIGASRSFVWSIRIVRSDASSP